MVNKSFRCIWEKCAHVCENVRMCEINVKNVIAASRELHPIILQIWNFAYFYWINIAPQKRIFDSKRVSRYIIPNQSTELHKTEVLYWIVGLLQGRVGVVCVTTRNVHGTLMEGSEPNNLHIYNTNILRRWTEFIWWLLYLLLTFGIENEKTFGFNIGFFYGDHVVCIANSEVRTNGGK